MKMHDQFIAISYTHADSMQSLIDNVTQVFMCVFNMMCIYPPFQLIVTIIDVPTSEIEQAGVSVHVASQANIIQIIECEMLQNIISPTLTTKYDL